jgi:hypothetical protein
MQTSSVAPTAPAPIAIHATWSDHGRLGIPHEGRLAVNDGTVNGSGPSVLATSRSFPSVNVPLAGVPAFDRTRAASDPSAGSTVAAAVRTLEGAGLLKPGYAHDPAKGELLLTVNDRGTANTTRSALLQLNDSSEPAATAIRAILDLNKATLA